MQHSVDLAQKPDRTKQDAPKVAQQRRDSTTSAVFSSTSSQQPDFKADWDLGSRGEAFSQGSDGTDASIAEHVGNATVGILSSRSPSPIGRAGRPRSLSFSNTDLVKEQDGQTTEENCKHSDTRFNAAQAEDGHHNPPEKLEFPNSPYPGFGHEYEYSRRVYAGCSPGPHAGYDFPDQHSDINGEIFYENDFGQQHYYDNGEYYHPDYNYQPFHSDVPFQTPEDDLHDYEMPEFCDNSSSSNYNRSDYYHNSDFSHGEGNMWFSSREQAKLGADGRITYENVPIESSTEKYHDLLWPVKRMSCLACCASMSCETCE